MSGQAAYFEAWCSTLSNKWCGKKSFGKTPSPGLLLWGFLWEEARLSHPLLYPTWCSVIIMCGTISCFQELLQCWTSTLWVSFFSLCSVLYDPEDIVLWPLFSSSMWRRWYFLSQRLLWKLLVGVGFFWCVCFFSPLTDGRCYERAKHRAGIDLFVRESWCYFRDIVPPSLSNLLERPFSPLLLLFVPSSSHLGLCWGYWWRRLKIRAVATLPLECPVNESPTGQPEPHSAWWTMNTCQWAGIGPCWSRAAVGMISLPFSSTCVLPERH